MVIARLVERDRSTQGAQCLGPPYRLAAMPGRRGIRPRSRRTSRTSSRLLKLPIVPNIVSSLPEPLPPCLVQSLSGVEILHAPREISSHSPQNAARARRIDAGELGRSRTDLGHFLWDDETHALVWPGPSCRGMRSTPPTRPLHWRADRLGENRAVGGRTGGRRVQTPISRRLRCRPGKQYSLPAPARPSPEAPAYHNESDGLRCGTVAGGEARKRWRRWTAGSSRTIGCALSGNSIVMRLSESYRVFAQGMGWARSKGVRGKHLGIRRAIEANESTEAAAVDERANLSPPRSGGKKSKANPGRSCRCGLGGGGRPP